MSIWARIPDYPNYMVSPDGEILSLNYNKTGKTKRLKFGNSNGYRNVNLKGKTLTVHRIVAEIFCEKTAESYCVNHIDGDKHNNSFNNLEWCDNSYNQLHSYHVLGNEAAYGMKHGISKLTNEQVLEIYHAAKNNEPYLALSKKFNISKATITNIKKGLVWSHLTGENRCL